MKWFDVFRSYSLKKLRAEKKILFFASLSILITTLISLLVPQIVENTKEYMYDSVENLNGADLMISAQYSSNDFLNEMEILKNEGYDIKFKGVTTSYFKSDDGKNTVGKLIYGNDDIGEGEIILYKSIAANMKVNIGDNVIVESSNTGSKKYTVKAIEGMPYGVDNDSETLGYGKIYSSDSDYNIANGNSFLIFIAGDDVEKIKERLKNIEDGYIYTSLEDREKSVQSDVDTQIVALSVVTTMGYILSIIIIITTTVMIILRRKKDFAIIRMLSISSKDLKKSILLEMSLVILIPIVLAAIASFSMSTMVINITENIELIKTAEKLQIIFKGFIFNCILFFTFLNIALFMLKGIKPLSIIKENENEGKKLQKKIIIFSILVLPIILFAYSLYVGRLSTFIGACLVILFIGVFLILIIIALKLITSIHFKNNVLIYGLRNIKRNYVSFIMILLSITMTSVFLLVGFTLNKTIEESMNKSMEDNLPYDHIVTLKEDILVNDFKDNASIRSYSKFNVLNGKVTTAHIKNKGITINSIKEEDYNAKYNIVEGEDIFEGNKDGILVSSKYSKSNNLGVNDYLSIETLSGSYEYKIKGIYDGGEFNSQTILKEYNGENSNGITYLIDSNDEKWIDSITSEAYIISVGTLSSSISSMLSKILNIFKYLCFLCIFSSILFNINMGYMDYMQNRKDETIIEAIGLGKGFYRRYQLFKITLLVVISALISFGTYSLVLEIALKLFLNSSTYISIGYLLISLFISICLVLLCFNLSIRNLNRKSSFELLRE